VPGSGASDFLEGAFAFAADHQNVVDLELDQVELTCVPAE
jgi:hypothetical protein